MNQADSGIYSELILDLYKNPDNAGSIENPSLRAEGGNPLCGDLVTMYVNLKDNLIQEIKFQGQGCAISIAAESILTHLVKGKTIDKVLEMDSETLLKELGPVVQTRIKCAILGLYTLQKGLEEYKSHPEIPKVVKGIKVK